MSRWILAAPDRAHLVGQLTRPWCKDSYEHSDHRLAVFSLHASVPQAVESLNFADESCPNSGLSCTHMALVFCDMEHD